ncbi:MAG TPA: phosphodiester glycosidase family protein [Anaeromyxobacteraceae bacterium]|nr:phosphodiester glycosidase family protein [Anaeromyxobacteraceae bacterium]
MLRGFFIVSAAALTIALTGATRPAAGVRWEAWEPGLEVAELQGPAGATGDGKITAVRIDPARFELRLLNASAPGEGTLRTARAWAARAGAAAAINASMYQEDYRTSTGLMRTSAHVNHRRVSRDKAVLAFEPLVPGVAPVRIIDRDCENLDASAKAYATLVQSIRMISCDRRNVWAPSDRRFSTAAIGVDGRGRVLFLHARSPWPVHQLVDALLSLPLDLRQAMYVEGGPEAQLYVRGGGRELEKVGGFESSLGEVADNRNAWPIPNVIAAVRKR